MNINKGRAIFHEIEYREKKGRRNTGVELANIRTRSVSLLFFTIY